MKHASIPERSTMITTDRESFAHSFAQDVDKGLSSSPKQLPCIYFYDYQGSLLFEEICRLPEYYLTDAETEILETRAGEIASGLPRDSLLVELGSGSCTKAQYIIDEMLNRYGGVTYCPVDISQEMLKESAKSLLERYGDLEIVSVAAEYGEGLHELVTRYDRPKMILWLGSSIGNFELNEAIDFLREIVGSLSPVDSFLIGFDLEKESEILESAYNDSLGVTAEFNLNLLSRINRELGGQFDLNRFVHRAIYNEERSRIEMYLISKREQQVYIGELDRHYHFERNERIHTENSRKYSPRVIETLAKQVGMKIIKQWIDPRKYFNLTLFKLDRR